MTQKQDATVPLKLLNKIEIQTAKGAVMLMWCVKKKTMPRRMARLLDVLRDLVSDNLLSDEVK